MLKVAKIVAGLLVVILVGIFLFRNIILNKAIERVSVKLKDKYQVDLVIEKASFRGITGVGFNNISLIPLNNDTILHFETVNAGLQLARAFLFDFRLANLELTNGFVHVNTDTSGRNIDVFLTSKSRGSVTQESIETSPSKPSGNMAKTMYKLINKVLSFVPNEVDIENVSLVYNDSEQRIALGVTQLRLEDKNLNSIIHINSNKVNQQWALKGLANPSNKQADVTFYNTDTGKVILPYLQSKFNLTAGFDSIRLKLDELDFDNGVLLIKGLASTRNFLVNHPKISSKDVVIEQAGFNYVFQVGAHSITVDSSSSVSVNQVVFHPFVKYEETEEDTTYQFNIVIEKTNAQAFINSLPEGLFKHFKGMEAEGSFAYRLDFAYSDKNPQDLIFDSKLERDGLRILKYGEANLSKLNGDFVHVAIENGRPQRHIQVSYDNPDFTPLEQISPLLRKTVLTTEDPSFFYHRGFIDEAFRQSIIKNIRKRKFARGASTISMQLVKNVFLTREKTLSRKLEEILLVYILENNRLSSKERMFEVYLNVIEWGPNVYGIAEAARFYFNKRPSELTLSESMFLSIIIPSPKKFMWRFGKDGQLKDHVGRHFHSLAGLMIRRDVLMQEDTMGLTHHISINGPAKGFIKVTADTLIQDTILLDENGLMIKEEE